ncbi:3-oxoacyl-ACP synthase III family protein [Kitasatospora sp. NPDC127116]|uniref:3-oxoacyl-ACP synthase III family protein n=1 Tax=Kitasatospora sp. NPDC127116 TaxID=3345367 RepID=UPI003632C454
MHPEGIHIVSTGTALPGPPVDNSALARRFGASDQWEEWIQLFIGTATRHLSVDLDTGERRNSLADLAELAGRRALDSASLAPEDIDLLVMGTATPDRLLPTTASVVAERLGIDDLPVFQLQSGCTGAFQALSTAHQLLGTGAYRRALVLGGELNEKYFDLGQDFGAMRPEQLINYVLFGDGAGAAVLAADPEGARAVVRHSSVRLTGLGRPAGQILEWFGPADRTSDRIPAVEDYKEIEASVPRMSREILDRLLSDLRWTPEDVHYVMPPQLSGRMTRKVLEALALPGAQEISCVVRTGNTGNATPFFQLEQALDLMSPGDRALGISVESSKWIRAGLAIERV